MTEAFSGIRWGRVFAAVAVACLTFGVWQGRQAERWQVERTAALADSRRQRAEDSVTVAEADRAVAAAETALAVANRHRDTPRPLPPLPPDTTASDSVRYWRARTTVAEEDARLAHAEADALRTALDSQKVATVRLRGAWAGEQARGDSLEAVLRRAPNPCPKFLGIPVPKVGPGAAVTTRGVQPAFAIIVPLGC